jgi:hypothetical protein
MRPKGSPLPKPFADLVELLSPYMAEVGEALLDQLDEDLGHEARRRIVLEAIAKEVVHVRYAFIDAIRAELMRPEPMPFSPPAAGSWIRRRLLPDPLPGRGGRPPLRLEPEWAGPWHLFSGDITFGDGQGQLVHGRSRCGRRVPLRLLADGGAPVWDFVAVPDRPAVDACRLCAKVSRRDSGSFTGIFADE